MSFLKAIFGKTFDEYLAEGKHLFAEGRYGLAKLSLDRALDKSKGVDASAIEAIKTMILDCKRHLATAKIAEADEAAQSHDMESATKLLQDALEICDETSISTKVTERIKQYEAMDARRLVEEEDQIDDDELLTIIAGTWSDDQAEEYSKLPEEFHDALLADHDGKHDEAAEIFKTIIAQKNLSIELKYLYFETGKALTAASKNLEALEMFDLFFAASNKTGASSEIILAAHDMKAEALAATERWEEAEEELRKAAKDAPSNHRVFLKLGVFLRNRKKPEQSLKMLEKARELMGQMHPDFSVIRELGFTYLVMEKKDEAAECFSSIIEHLASKGEHSQFDPITAVTLASLQEEKGQYQKAADLYRHLAVGYDTANYFVYNYQAAKLLMKAKADSALIDKYLARARETANTEDNLALLENLEQDEPSVQKDTDEKK